MEQNNQSVAEPLQPYMKKRQAQAVRLVAQNKYDEAFELEPNSYGVFYEILEKIFVLVGECNHCANCCRHSLLLINGKPFDTVEEFEKSFEKYPENKQWIPITDKAERLFFSCRHISDDNSCPIYEQRPDHCRNYPNSRTKIPEHCGFRQKINLRKNEIKNPELLQKIKENARMIGLQKEYLKTMYPEVFSPIGIIVFAAKLIFAIIFSLPRKLLLRILKR